MRKVPRFLREYASFRIRNYRQVTREFPRCAEDAEKRIDRIEKVVRAYENGVVSEDEAIRVINEA